MNDWNSIVTTTDHDETDPPPDAGNPAALLERILECAADGIYGLDRDGRVTFVNPAAERMTGYSRNEQQGNRQHELIHHTQPDGTPYPGDACPIHATLRDGETRTVEGERFWRRDGTSFPVIYTSSPLVDENGATTGAVVTFTDVSERADERRYRSLVTATSAFVWRCTPAGDLTHISDAWLELVGLSLEDAAGWGWLAVVHPDDQDLYHTRWQWACQAATVFEHEYRLCCHDGSVRWFLDRAVPVRDDAGRVLEWMGTGQDVTERRRAEEETRRQREQYRTLVESTSAISWAADPEDFRFTYVSPEAETLLGYPARRWTEEPGFWVNHIHPDDSEWAPAYCARATAEMRQHTFDYRMVAADGRIVWLRDVVSVLAENEKPVKLVGVMLDITKTKENERALEYASGLESALVQVSKSFLDSTPEQLDAVISEALGRVGAYCDVDRSYLFRFRDGRRFMDNTHEWCAPGIEKANENMQNLSSDDIPTIIATLERHEIVRIPRVADLGPGWSAEKTRLERHEVKSLVVIPIVVAEELHGCLGFDSVRCEREWRDEEVRLLLVLADLVAATIQRDTTEEALRASESLRFHGESLAHLGSWEWDVVNDRFLPSAEWRRVTGCEAEPLCREDVLALVHPEDLPAIRATLARTIERGEPFDVEHRVVRPENGETRWIKVHAEMSYDNGSPVTLYGFVQDVTERKSIEAAVAESEARYRSVVENISEVVYQTDEQGFFTFLNPAWEQITGFTIDESVGTHFLDYVHPDDAAHSREEHERLASGESSSSRFEERYVTRQWGIRWIGITSQAITDDEGRFQGCIGTLRDVTEQRKAEQQMLYLAEYDTLTDLPNRMLALDRLGQFINALPRSDGFVAVLYLDLDQFKKVNDTLGHEVGDEVLVQTAKRLRASVRSQDTVARLGGDEFLLLLGGLRSPAAVQPVVESLLHSFDEPFIVDGREVALSASIGVAIAPTDGGTSTDLLRNADMAMYQSKSAGRNTYHYFTEAMNREVARRTAIEEQLRGALERDELKVAYQPVIDLVENSIVGAEALLRWHNPDFGDVNVEEVVSIAEQTGLIHDIGEHVLNQALHQAASWRERYRPDFRIAVNVSPQQFRDRRLVDRIRQGLHREGLPGDALEVEITEGVLLTGQTRSTETLHALRGLGVRVAMDDFGTGYASLSYLRQYSFDTLKIDRSFVGGMTTDSNDRELVVTSLRLANGLGLTAVAEGVETEAQLHVLRDSGCRLAQGYLFSPAVHAGQFAALLPLWPPGKSPSD